MRSKETPLWVTGSDPMYQNKNIKMIINSALHAITINNPKNIKEEQVRDLSHIELNLVGKWRLREMFVRSNRYKAKMKIKLAFSHHCCTLRKSCI
jgi:hypothetical protein